MRQKYSSYKDSGVEWIGDIPSHWEVIKLKYCCSINTGSKDTINKVDDGEFPFFVRSQTVERINSYSYDGEAVLTAGDGVGTGKVFHYCNGKFDYHQRVYKFSDFRKISGKLFFEFIRNKFICVVQDQTAKSTVDSLRLPMIQDFFFAIPPQSEQQQIVTYLDQKTSQIDTLVSLTEKKIELLKEKRTSLINEAVTKGLDKTVKMKDSGVEWIGEIPEVWGVKRIKHITYVKGRIGWQGMRSDEFLDDSDSYVVTGTDFENGRIKWETCHQVPLERYDEDPFIQLKNDDLLITKDGTIGKVALVKQLPKIATLNSGVFLTRPKDTSYSNSFMYWILISDVFRIFYDFNKSGSTIQHLYQNVFDEFKFPLPPLQEQQQIVDYINHHTSEIDKLISIEQRRIDTLKEYRQSLISEVVTGKVKVK